MKPITPFCTSYKMSSGSSHECSSTAVHRNGYTLIELLLVMAIIAILSSLAIGAFKSLSTSGNVFTGGNFMASTIDSARGLAIAQHTPTAVAVLTTGTGIANRVFTVLEYAAPVPPSTTGTWNQASKWYVLPQGVILDTGTGTDTSGNLTTPFLLHSPVPGTSGEALPGLTYLGTTYQPNVTNGVNSGYGYFIILENGSIFHDASANANPPTPSRLRVLPGFINSANALQLTGALDGTGRSANYYDIIVNESTGHTKIVRP